MADMRSTSRHFDTLREHCERTPIVDCHDHTQASGPQQKDPLQAILLGYFPSDLESAGGGRVAKALEDLSQPLEERWAVIEPAWRRARLTGYGYLARLVLREFYGEKDLSLAALARIREKLQDYSDNARFESVLDKARIVARLEDSWPDPAAVLKGTHVMSPRGRLMVSLPGMHNLTSREQVEKVTACLGRTVTTLDEYVEACREIVQGFRRYGAVGFKDQSAYERTLAYGNPTRAEAESVFNWMMEDPRRKAGWPDQAKPLSDWLFHAFLRMARELDMPVQIHTGHMAGIRNEIAKTNAVHLTSVLELHRDVRFDLFHANWPYGGEALFLVKNYPNVCIDFCWANIIDPVFSQSLFKQALSSVPHGKVHGYGTDYMGYPDHAWAHAHMARDNIAIALSDMVDMHYLDMDEAREVAGLWLSGNADGFYRLGLGLAPGGGPRWQRAASGGSSSAKAIRGRNVLHYQRGRMP